MANTVLANLAAALSGFKVSTTGELSTTITLTNGQIIALPTTPITLVAAPGTNSWIKVRAVTLSANTVAGAYTNVNTTYNAISLTLGTHDVVYGVVNDSTVTPPLTVVTDLLASAAQRLIALNVPPLGAPESTGLQYVQPTFVLLRTQVENAALKIAMDNNGSGVLTAGHSANTLKVTVYYHIEAL